MKMRRYRRISQLVKFVTPFGSPCTMERASAEILYKRDNELYISLLEAGSAEGLSAPWIEYPNA